MKPKTLKKELISTVIFAMTCVSFGYAQDETSKGEEVYTLSPFVVDSEADDGYIATSTLAGTRIRSSLKDVASSISVFTPELLEDIAASDMQDAMLYSVNVENENEFAEDDSEGESISRTTQTRVRGLSMGTPTTNYFKTNFQADTYNSSRFTSARGPNSILFGIGSPAGVINSTQKQAVFGRTLGSVSLKIDNWDSHRESVDFNIPVLKDRIAIRVAAMNQDDRSWIHPEFDKESRLYMTATLKLLENTTVRVSHETIDNERVRARRSLYLDGISDWLANGSPLYNHLSGAWTYDNGQSWEAMRNPVAGGNYTDNSNRQTYMLNGFLSVDNSEFDRLSIDGVTNARLKQDNVQAIVWHRTGLSYNRVDTPATPILSFSDDRYLASDVNILGVADKTDNSGHATSVVLEQKVLENLHFEFAYNSEKFDRMQVDPLRFDQAIIQADVNYYLPLHAKDHSLASIDNLGVLPNNTNQWLRESNGDYAMVRNPNVGRTFVDSLFVGYIEEIQTETARGMASYELDLTEKSKWLGRHNFGLLYQKEMTDKFRIKNRVKGQGEYFWRGNPRTTYNQINNPNINPQYHQGTNDVMTRVYLDVPGIPDSNGVTYAGDYVLPSFDAVIAGIHGDGKPQLVRQDVDSQMFVMQSRFLEDDLILTFGYRRDNEKVYNQTGFVRDPATGIFQYEGIGLPDDASNEASGITRTHGLVYHTPIDGLSVYFNKSNTFNPQGNDVDFYGKSVGHSTGDGTDYGISLDLFDGKLIAKVGLYENTLNNAREVNWYYEVMKWNMVNAMEAEIDNWADINAERGLDTSADVNRPAINDSLRMRRDFSSEGLELELLYRPIEGLDIRFTAAKVDATRSALVPNLQKYVTDRLPVWEKYFALPRSSQIPDPTDPSQDPAVTDWINQSGTIGNHFYRSGSAYPRYLSVLGEEGLSAPRSRKWRANVIVNYRLSDGRFKGTSLGGAVRWRDRAPIGYLGKSHPELPEGSYVSDLDSPIYGESEMNIDGWIKYQRPIKFKSYDLTWVVQLNVRNLFNDDDIIPTAANELGTMTRYSRREPRKFILTNTIRF